MKIRELTKMIGSGGLDEKLRALYGEDYSTLAVQRARYGGLVEQFHGHFPAREAVQLFAAPGRSEIGGNHTDHQHGCALAAAVDLDIAAAVAFHDDGVIRLYSEGYGMTSIELSDLNVRDDEKGTTAALLRGICALFAEQGARIGGFDAYLISDVPAGSGLSSSAAFETLIGTIINAQYGGRNATPEEIARIGQAAENVYFGKKSGLLDQMTCAVGGTVFLDFCDTAQPRVEKIDFDFAAAGYSLCVTDTKGSHSDLTEDYCAVSEEMQAVAACFGKEVLREVEEQAFLDAIPSLRGKCSDRAILRAMHFFGENRRAQEEAQAMKQGDMERLIDWYRRSAASSANYLQNLYTTKKPTEQGIPLGIAVSRLVLGEAGAVRVHGGGFAGTIQAIVPVEKTAEYVQKMDALFGENSCHVLRIRKYGGVRIVQ